MIIPENVGSGSVPSVSKARIRRGLGYARAHDVTAHGPRHRSLIDTNHPTYRKHVFLALEMYIYFFLSLLDLFTHTLPTLGSSLDAFRTLDIFIGKHPHLCIKASVSHNCRRNLPIPPLPVYLVSVPAHKYRARAVSARQVPVYRQICPPRLHSLHPCSERSRVIYRDQLP